MAADFLQRPDRVTLLNLESGDELEAQFNPEVLDEDIPVNWNRLAIPGYSHEPMQYANTGNMSWSFDLRYNVLLGETTEVFEQVNRARRFLLALAYSKRGANSVKTGSLPRVLFLWPNLVSVVCKIAKLSFKHDVGFNKQMGTQGFTAALTLEEFRDVRLYSEDVFVHGTLRSGSASEEGGS